MTTNTDIPVLPADYRDFLLTYDNSPRAADAPYRAWRKDGTKFRADTWEGLTSQIDDLLGPVEPVMDNYRATALAEGFEDGTEEEIIAAWQHLHDTGLAYRLQGWFGRTATHLIEEGVIHA